MTQNPYSLLGIGLLLAGALFTPTSYFILLSIPLTALGISLLILGSVCLALGKTRPKIPPELSSLLLEIGLDNISTLLEELGLKSKAVYLPPSMIQGKPRALIPLHSNPSLPEVKGPLSQRLIVKYGPNPEDVGLLVTTLGSVCLGMLESPPGSTTGELEASLFSILGGVMDMADGVRVTERGLDKILVEVISPRLIYRNLYFYRCLGSPLASVVASFAASALNKPVVINREAYKKNEGWIELGVLG